MTDARDPVRHDLLRLTAAGWAAATVRDRGLHHWAEHGLPVMRRRPQPGDQVGLIPVAVALPPAHGRARLAFQVAPSDIASIAPPPTLRDAIGSLPHRMHPRATAVLECAAALGLTPRLFGSAMWQHVTGMSYLHERSDLDLLWNIPDASVIARLVAALHAIDTSPDPRLDGEIVRGGTHAVNWRELAPDGPSELLVKTGEAVMLMPRDAFLQRERAPC